VLRRLLVGALLVGLTLVPYAQALRFDFVTWDDPVYVTGNLEVRQGLTLPGVKWAFTTGEIANWQPLVTVSHMLAVELFGLEPAGHHAVNLALHVANVLVLFALLVSMTSALGPSAFAAALFAVHPLNVEAVAWISARKDVLSTLFGLLSTWAYAGYVRHGGRGRYALCALLLALGLMCKPMLVTLPVLFLLLDYWPLGRAWSRRALLDKVPLLGLSLASAIVTFAIQARAGGVDVPEPIPLPLRAANGGMSYVRYLGKLLWPTDLSVLYPHPNLPGGTPWGGWQIAAAVALLAIISIALGVSRRRYLVVGWLWYVIALLPVSGLVPSGFEAMADRWGYLPLMGLFIAIAWGGAEVARRRPYAVSAAAVAAVVAATASTWRQVGYWRDSITLYEHSLRAAPDPPYLRYNLGNALERQGRTDEAIRQYQRAVAISPGYSVAHNNLGAALLGQGRTEEAITQLDAAVRGNPRNAQAQNNLGRALEVKGRLDEASAHYRAAIEARPGYALAHFNLARVLEARGQLDEAVAHYQETVRLQPDFAPAQSGLRRAQARRSQGGPP
jgi:tetratricopeptide (TPR) repeat protein